MALKDLSCRNLADVDGGRIEAMFDLAVQRALMDCADRPGDRSSRTITLTIKLTPILDQSGCFDEFTLSPSCDCKLPSQKARDVVFGAQRRAGKFVGVFNKDSDDVRQSTLEFPDEGT